MSEKALQEIDYLLEDSRYDYDEYMYYNHRDVNMGKFETISEQQVNAIAKEIYGYDYTPSFNEQATQPTYGDEMTPLQDYMATREDKR